MEIVSEDGAKDIISTYVVNEKVSVATGTERGKVGEEQTVF